MPDLILAVLLITVALYVVQMGVAALGFARVRRDSQPSAPSTWPMVSVVVPARNEADAITDCLDSLRACDYPDDRWELIVVDDFSTDGTSDCVKAHQPDWASSDGEVSVRLVQRSVDTAENGGHKSAALEEGVEAAQGEVILTTDADCTVPPTWIRSMVRRCTPDTPFVAGPVAYEHNERFLPRLQALELIGLVGYGAGTLGIGLPTFCNSANVAYRREVLDAHDTVPNGAAQDEMLLQHVAYATEREVAFNPDPEALVTTQPTSSFWEYLRQQARWAHMGLRYPFEGPRALVVGLWLAHAVLLLCCAVAVFAPAWRQPTLLALLGKMGGDALLAAPAARHFGSRDLLRSTVPTELLLVLTVPFAGLLGSFGPLEWKGRSLNE